MQEKEKNIPNGFDFFYYKLIIDAQLQENLCRYAWNILLLRAASRLPIQLARCGFAESLQRSSNVLF